MADELDHFVEALQDQIFSETREAYGDVAFERWQNLVYAGVLEHPDGYGRVTGTCGDTVQIFLEFENNVVKDATFVSDGCGCSQVCGSFAAELARGKTPDELVEITGDTILAAVGRLPEEEQHCAFLSAATLQDALNDYMVRHNRLTDDRGGD